MIKKSVFEAELINGMQRELRPYDQKQGFASLDKAVDYLNSAVEIFEEAGMTSKADQLLRILGKIAIGNTRDTKVKQMPSMNALMENGVTKEDIKGLVSGDAFSKARVNTAFRLLGYTDKEISHLIGHHNLMHEKEADEILSKDRSFEKIKEWIKDPTMAVDPSNPKPGETINFNRLPSERKELPPGEDLVFRSIAQGKLVHDRHTQGLTSEKMLANLKHHGTEFNMSDDGIENMIEESLGKKDFFEKLIDEERKKQHNKKDIENLLQDKSLNSLFKKHPRFETKDDFSFADDLLNADINDDPLDIIDNDAEKSFEDEEDNSIKTAQQAAPVAKPAPAAPAPAAAVAPAAAAPAQTPAEAAASAAAKKAALEAAKAAAKAAATAAKDTAEKLKSLETDASLHHLFSKYSTLEDKEASINYLISKYS